MLETIFYVRGDDFGVSRFVQRVALHYESDLEDEAGQRLFKTRKLEALFDLAAVLATQYSSQVTVSIKAMI